MTTDERPTATDMPSRLHFEWYPAGHVLVRQGGKTGKLFVLKSGEVEVERDGVFVSSATRPGVIFGEMSLLLDTTHSATVRAVSDIEVYVIEDALAVLEANPGWTLQIARLLAQRVNATTAQLAESRGGAPDAERLVLPQNVLASWGDPQV
ncbi:MAG TPA: cyclic nucleotide-binding domain-containing protein [Devosiaceae bacterium]|nr:cyclic nucleotide-binding domain-containing protein [Devosiaceae bacterium]